MNFIDDVYRLYTQPGATITGVANHLSTTRYAVIKALRQAGLKPVSRLPRKSMADAYITSDRSLSEVANEYGVSVSTVYEAVIEHYGSAGKQKTIVANKRRSRCVNYYDLD